MPVLDKLLSWVWVILILAIPFVLAYAVRLVRFFVNRIRLAAYLKSIGARPLRRRPVDRIFRTASPGAVRVYLLHPHPFALTLALRQKGKYNRSTAAGRYSQSRCGGMGFFSWTWTRYAPRTAPSPSCVRPYRIAKAADKRSPFHRFTVPPFIAHHSK